MSLYIFYNNVKHCTLLTCIIDLLPILYYILHFINSFTVFLTFFNVRSFRHLKGYISTVLLIVISDTSQNNV